MSQTVLVVDDSIPLHKLVRTHLEPDRVSVHSAYDGESAMAMATSLRPSLILLDVDMPNLDGFEVCRRLKANGATAMIPVVFLTANSVAENKVKGLELGASDYITKPFKPQELRARVRAVLRGKHQLEANTMVDGLTGLWNRDYLNRQLPSLLSLSKRMGSPLGCIICEIDQHGGGLADEAARSKTIRSVARILVGQCRAEDVVCRWEDCKFALLFVGQNRAAGAHIADRLRAEMERQMEATGSGQKGGFACSFGVSDTVAAEGAGLLDAAEAAVYRGRGSRGNRVRIAREAAEELHARV